jgi:hypothetical protein
MIWQVLADLVLTLHLALAAFVVAYPVLVLAGGLIRRPGIDRFGLRLGHAALTALVAVQSWFGAVCPLTTLESALRRRATQAPYDGGFIEHWLGSILFYEAPPWAFTTAYTAFALLVAAMWWRFPPPARTRSAGERDRPLPA